MKEKSNKYNTIHATYNESHENGSEYRGSRYSDVLVGIIIHQGL